MPFSLRQNVGAHGSFLEVVLSGAAFEVCIDANNCVNEQLNVGMNRGAAADASITIHARGLFWLMRVQYYSFNHFSSIVILF